MGDQSAGLISAVDRLGSVPHSQLQFCNWHAVQAMRAKFTKSGYTIEELDGFIDGEVQVPGLIDHAWAYVESDTVEALGVNRATLMGALKIKDQKYISQNWVAKEYRTIFCFTKTLANLGSVATQRSESYHPSFKKVTNGQLSLQESAIAISQKWLSIMKQLTQDEDRALIDADLALDMTVFKYLVCAVSTPAIRMIEREWLELQDLILEGKGDKLKECECQILLRYSLPCKHHLLRACLSGEPIPKSLVHPRWWLKGPTIRQSTWAPSYAVEQGLVLSPRRKDIYKAVQTAMEARARLGVEDQSRWDGQFIGGLSKLTTAAERREELAQIPIGVPDAVPKKTWRKKKTHGKANARELTALELAELEKAEEIRRGKARAAIPEDIEEEEDEQGFLVPDSPPPFPARAGESQGGTTITIGPPPLVSPGPPSPPPRSPSPPGLPPSTAPPRLEQEQEEGRGKRKRVYTETYKLGREQGLQYRNGDGEVMGRQI
jgi:hypothetical protein